LPLDSHLDCRAAIVEGFFQIALALRYRNALPGSWGWLLASGLVDLAIAILIIRDWPSTSVWTLGLLAGLNLISTGSAIIITAIQARRFAKTLKEALS
jgi:uncharacterized membrane protein HdeD (DUF308 family)